MLKNIPTKPTIAKSFLGSPLREINYDTFLIHLKNNRLLAVLLDKLYIALEEYSGFKLTDKEKFFLRIFLLTQITLSSIKSGYNFKEHFIPKLKQMTDILSNVHADTYPYLCLIKESYIENDNNAAIFKNVLDQMDRNVNQGLGDEVYLKETNGLLFAQSYDFWDYYFSCANDGKGHSDNKISNCLNLSLNNLVPLYKNNILQTYVDITLTHIKDKIDNNIFKPNFTKVITPQGAIDEIESLDLDIETYWNKYKFEHIFSEVLKNGIDNIFIDKIHSILLQYINDKFVIEDESRLHPDELKLTYSSKTHGLQINIDEKLVKKYKLDLDSIIKFIFRRDITFWIKRPATLSISGKEIKEIYYEGYFVFDNYGHLRRTNLLKANTKKELDEIIAEGFVNEEDYSSFIRLRNILIGSFLNLHSVHISRNINIYKETLEKEGLPIENVNFYNFNNSSYFNYKSYFYDYINNSNLIKKLTLEETDKIQFVKTKLLSPQTYNIFEISEVEKSYITSLIDIIEKNSTKEKLIFPFFNNFLIEYSNLTDKKLFKLWLKNIRIAIETGTLNYK